MKSLTCGLDFERFQQGSANGEIGISIISLLQDQYSWAACGVRLRMTEGAWQVPGAHVPVPGMKHPMRQWPSSCHSHTMAWPTLFCCRTIAWAGTGIQFPSM